MKPIIGITMGEPAGIGPEICFKALTNPAVYEICRPLILGDAAVIRQAQEFTQGIWDKHHFQVQTVKPGTEPLEHLPYAHKTLLVYDFQNLNLSQLRHGVDSAQGGKAAGDYIKASIDLALAEKIQAVVTAPISKTAFTLGGWGQKYPGHTEMFADLTHTQNFALLLASGSLRAIHVTNHVPLRQAIDLITPEKVLETIRLAHRACRMLGIERPRIAVCGVNPHAGEGGLMGREEMEQIQPAIETAKAEQLWVEGPLPADTVWPKVSSGYYDIAVAMYHDQGGIPVKLSGFQANAAGQYSTIHGINITVGIPIIRVSVDHGTAYEIAGQGVATPSSLLDAIFTAVQLAQFRAKEQANSAS